MDAPDKFISMSRHPIRFRMFLFWKLPAAFFSGVRIASIDREQATVTVPLRWLTQNPFRSTYFASLAMAAEMSTGALGMMYVSDRKPAISMLITKMESNYFKKATGRTRFQCKEGLAVSEAVETAARSGEPQTIRLRSTGTNDAGEPVAEFLFTWSFRVRKG